MLVNNALYSQTYNLSQQTSGTNHPLWSVRFVDNRTGFVSGNNGLILKTVDGGTNWVATTSGTTQTLFSLCFIGLNTGWATGAHCTLLKTTNGGTSWVVQNTGQINDHFFSVYFADDQTGFLVTQRGYILKTTDGGNTWVNKLSTPNPFLFSVYFSSARTGYAVGGTGHNGNNPSAMKVLKTMDGGENWIDISNGVTDGMLRAVHFPNAQTGYAVGNKNNGLAAILKTTDGGSSWIEKTLPVKYGLRSVYFTSTDTGFSCGESGLMLRTTDGGNNWADISDLVSRQQNRGQYANFYNNSRAGWTVGSNGSIIKYSSSANTPAVTIPTVTSQSVGAITSITATSGGDITSDGGSAVTARGVCWATTQNPTTSNSKTIDGSGTGVFTSSLTGLTPNTSYFLRAYATNSAGTAYGNQVSFTTASATSIVTDIDGNVYKTVTLGNQVWMKENLRVTRYNNGDLIGTTATPTLNINNENMPKYEWVYWPYTNDVVTNGRLYTWYTVTDNRNVCPAGWHLPSDSEWETLENYLIANGYNYDGSTTGNKIAKSLASTARWSGSSGPGWVGTDLSLNNSSGFTAVPSGYRYTHGLFTGAYNGCAWWTSSESNSINAWARDMSSNTNYVTRADVSKIVGLSVRCIKD